MVHSNTYQNRLYSLNISYLVKTMCQAKHIYIYIYLAEYTDTGFHSDSKHFLSSENICEAYSMHAQVYVYHLLFINMCLRAIFNVSTKCEAHSMQSHVYVY